MIYEEQGFEKLAEDVVGYMKQWHPDFNGSFKVWTRRAKKSYPIRSMEVSAELGGRILDAFPEASVCIIVLLFIVFIYCIYICCCCCCIYCTYIYIYIYR